MTDRSHPKQAEAQHRLDVLLQPATVDALKKLRWLFSSAIPDIDVGQLWRAEWESVTLLGVTLATEDGYAQFAPLTVDIECADPYTVVLSGDSSPLPVAVAVFAGMTTPVPVYVLEANVGELSRSIASEIVGIWRSSQLGAPPISTCQLGSQMADPLEVRYAYRAELLAQLTVLASAILDGHGLTLNKAEQDKSSVGRILPSRIADFLDLQPRVAREIAVGRYPLSGPQVERLAASLGCETADLSLIAVSIPRPLIEALYSPRRFSVVRELARQHDVSYADAVAFVPSAVSARTQHARVDSEETQEYWEDLLEALAAGGVDAAK